ncbi:hypothetical protein CBR_g4333 [Chara braunii]|uniref:Myb/SANT-like DNA-binding domain-containing protein n=1 Tax=Chara braunii TaxID=69332 RepID=A0A388JRF3_CHABU|nr:hypothetical protein CBR_g4333 [Chara braunii]|eukprot:GBG60375.1 hypothetical protein CBR_g4333 [Chara braunii]
MYRSSVRSSGPQAGQGLLSHGDRWALDRGTVWGGEGLVNMGFEIFPRSNGPAISNFGRPPPYRHNKHVGRLHAEAAVLRPVLACRVHGMAVSVAMYGSFAKAARTSWGGRLLRLPNPTTALHQAKRCVGNAAWQTRSRVPQPQSVFSRSAARLCEKVLPFIPSSLVGRPKEIVGDVVHAGSGRWDEGFVSAVPSGRGGHGCQILTSSSIVVVGYSCEFGTGGWAVDRNASANGRGGGVLRSAQRLPRLWNGRSVRTPVFRRRRKATVECSSIHASGHASLERLPTARGGVPIPGNVRASGDHVLRCPDNEPVSTLQCGQGTQHPIDAEPPATSTPSSTGARPIGRKPRQGRQPAPRSPAGDGDTEDNGEGGKQKKKPWSLEERLALAKYMREDDAMMAVVQPRQKHQRRSVRNDWVARRIKEDGYHRSAEDERKKWADLQNKYREIHDKCGGSGKPSF